MMERVDMMAEQLFAIGVDYREEARFGSVEDAASNYHLADAYGKAANVLWDLIDRDYEGN
jgi:hypothetical protein